MFERGRGRYEPMSALIIERRAEGVISELISPK
jgi:hypothetical protein